VSAKDVALIRNLTLTSAAYADGKTLPVGEADQAGKGKVALHKGPSVVQSDGIEVVPMYVGTRSDAEAYFAEFSGVPKDMLY